MSIASQLSKQLSKLQTRPTNDDKLAKSFLFSNTDAKELSREQIHEIGVAGMRTLLSIDNRFTDILEVLFSPDRIRRERSMYSTEENAEINQAIDKLCTLMGPHLFVTATHQVLEYLIRVFEVNSENVNTLLRMFLPYHDHAIFARLLMVLDLRGSGFDYLEKNQLNGAPLPRTSLVTTAADNGKVLKLICNAASDALTMGVANNAAFALFAGVSCKMATSTQSDAVLRILLPYLVKFLSCDDSGTEGVQDESSRKKGRKGEVFDNAIGGADGVGSRPRASVVWGMAVSSAMIVVHAWCANSSLTPRVLCALIRPIVDALTTGGTVTLGSGSIVTYPVTIPEIVRFIGHVVRTQPNSMADATMSPILTQLLSLPWGNWLSSGLVHQYVITSANSNNASTVHPGVFALLRRLLDFSLLQLKQFLPVATGTAPYVLLISAACSQMRGLSAEDVRVVFDSLLAYCCGLGGEKATAVDASLIPVLVSCLKSIERMYPLHFDKAVAAAISNTRNKNSNNKKDSIIVDADSVIRFISQHFVGTKFELLDVSGALGRNAANGSLPLLSCLLHHVPAVRQLAIVALTKQLQATSTPSLFANEVKGMKSAEDDEEENQDYKTRSTEGSLMPLLTAAISSETSPSVGAVSVALVQVVLEQYLVAVAAKDTPINCLVMGASLSTLMSAAWRMVSSSLEESMCSPDAAVAVSLGQLCSKSVSALRPHGVAYSVYSEALFILTTLALSESAATTTTGETFMDMLSTVCDVAEPAAAATSSKKAENDSDSSSDDDEASAVAAQKSKKKSSPYVVEKVLCGSAIADMWSAVSKAPACGGADVIARLIEEYENSVRLLGSKFDLNTLLGQNRHLSQNSELAVLVAVLTRCAIVKSTSSVASNDSIAFQAKKFLDAVIVRALSTDSAATSVDMIHTIIGLVLQNVLKSSSSNAFTINKENCAELATYLTLTQHLPVQFLSGCPASVLWRFVSADAGCVSCSPSSIALFKKYLVYLKKSGSSSPLIKNTESVDVEEDCGEYVFNSLVTALYKSPATSTSLFNASKGAESRAAALLVLMMPILAPKPQLRQKAAETLQSAFLKGGSSSPSAATGGMMKMKDKKRLAAGGAAANPTPLLMLVEILKGSNSTLYSAPLSITSLSSLVETLAIGGTRAPAPMTDDAVKFVSDLAYRVCGPTTASQSSNDSTVSLAVLSRVIKQVFVSAASGTGKGGEIVLTRFKAQIEKCIDAADGELSHDEVSLISALLATSLSLSHALKTPASFPTVCWAVGALLKKGTIVYTSTFSTSVLAAAAGVAPTTERRRHPVYLSILRALAAIPVASATKYLVDQAGAGSVGSMDSILRDTFVPLFGKGASSVSWLQNGGADVAAETSELERISTSAAIVAFLAETHVGHELFFSTVIPRVLQASSVAGNNNNTTATASSPKSQKRSRTADPVAAVVVDAIDVASTSTILEMATDVIRHMMNTGSSDATDTNDTSAASTIFGKLQANQSLSAQTVKALFDAASALVTSTISTSTVINGMEQLHVDALRLLRMLVVAATQMPHDQVALDASSPSSKKSDAESSSATSVSILSYITFNTNVATLAPCFAPVLSASTSSTEPVSNYRTTSGVVVSASARAVLQIAAVDLLQSVVSAVVGNSIALGGPKGVLQARHNLLSHSLLLLVNILTFEGPEGAGAVPSHLGRVIHIISPILRIDRKDVSTKPVKAGKGGDSAAVAEASEEGANSSFIHLPIAALFLRLLLQWEETAVSQTNASNGAWISDDPVDVVLSIVGQLGINEQISCIHGLMNLVASPKKHLDLIAGSDGSATSKAPVQAEAMRALCTKLLKPSRISNRQEPFLNLIVRLIKSDAFLGLFVEMQHQGARHTKKSIHDAVNNKKPSKKSASDAEKNSDDDGEDGVAEGGERSTSLGNAECAQLLVASLEMYTTFHENNIGTPASLDTEVSAHEAKAYAMLLELLASNALACILAAINEPTFIDCQLKLLSDPRDGLRRKGITSLVDRLHQSLPLDEFELTPEESESRRKDLRDPKKTFSPTDLVELRARPLTTKRSAALLPVLLKLITAEMQGCGLGKAVRAAADIEKNKQLNQAISAAASLNRDASSEDLQLIVATLEELIRIIGGGGSTRAEVSLTKSQFSAGMSTPANATRGETELFQFFGNKFRVEEVHQFMSLALCSLSEIANGTSFTADQLVLGSTFIIASSTVMRTLGVTFAVRHSERYLQMLSQWMSVVRVCCNVSGSSEASKQRRIFDAADPVIALTRQALLSALRFNLPLVWLGASVHVPAFLAFISLNCNCMDSTTVETVAELLLQFRALLGPRAIFECLCGALSTTTRNNASTSLADASISPFTHDVRLIFTFINTMLKDLTKDDLEGIPVLVLGDSSFSSAITQQHVTTGPKKNFWTAALSALTSGSGNNSTAIVASVDVMEPVFEAYATFFMKFREKKCNKLLSTLVQWAFGSSLGEEEGNGESADAVEGYTRTQLTKHYVFFSMYSHLLRAMRDVLVFSFPQLVQPIVEILAKYNATPFTLLSETGGEAAGAWIIHRRRMLAGRVLTSLKSVLEVVKLMSEVSTPVDMDDVALLDDGVTFFAREEIFMAMMPLMVAQLSNTVIFEQGESDNTVEDLNEAADGEDQTALISGDADRFGGGGAMLTDMTFNSTVQRSLIPSIRHYFISLQSPKLWSSTQKEILRLLRHPKYTVRKATLLLLNGIYKDGGDQLCATIMAEGLPAIVEMTEDTNRAVVEQARQLCNELSTISGQDVLFAMS